MTYVDEVLASAAGPRAALLVTYFLALDGELSPFKRGIERIVSANPVPVIPLRLHGLWQSMFSRHGGRRPLGRVRSRV